VVGGKGRRPRVQQALALVRRPLHRYNFPLLLILLLLIAPGVLVAAPGAQVIPPPQGTPVYGLRGTLRPVDRAFVTTQLVSLDETVYDLVGATPAIEQQLQQLRNRQSPVQVQVWGTLQASPTRLGPPQLIVTGLLAAGLETLTPAPPVSTRITPTTGSTATPMPSPWWVALYYANDSLAGTPVESARTPAVDFNWGTGAPVPEISPDRFSARFAQSVELAPGFYQLRAQADDGIRVFINDELVIDEWHLAEPPAYTVGRQLGGETHFVVEYFEAGGLASIHFDYERVDEFPVWRAQYYDNIALNSTPAWVRPESRGVDAQISHQWSLGAPVPEVMPEDNWSARWTGTFAFEPGNYIFRAEANDGVRVWLDGHQVIDQWRDGSHQAETVFRTVGAGQHTVTVEYYERGGIANLKVGWARIQQ
jgi:hypothetical protein